MALTVKSLFQAVLDKFKASDRLWDAVGGRLYLERAEQEAMDSYAVFHVISQTVVYEFESGREIEEFRLQFSLFDKAPSVEGVCDMFRWLTQVFDRCTLSFEFADYVSLEMSRVGSYLMREEDGYWMYAVDYLVTIQAAE